MLGQGGTFNEPHATLRIQWVWETRAGVALKSVPILMAASASWLLSKESTGWISKDTIRGSVSIMQGVSFYICVCSVLSVCVLRLLRACCTINDDCFIRDCDMLINYIKKLTGGTGVSSRVVSQSGTRNSACAGAFKGCLGCEFECGAYVWVGESIKWARCIHI